METERERSEQETLRLWREQNERLDGMRGIPEAMNALYREALREAELRLQNCWNAGQTFGYVREQAELGLVEVRAVLGK